MKRRDLAPRCIIKRSDLAPRCIIKRSDLTPLCLIKRSDLTPRCIIKRSDFTPSCIIKRSDLTPRCIIKRSDLTPRCIIKRSDLTPRCIFRRGFFQDVVAIFFHIIYFRFLWCTMQRESRLSTAKCSSKSNSPLYIQRQYLTQCCKMQRGVKPLFCMMKHEVFYLEFTVRCSATFSGSTDHVTSFYKNCLFLAGNSAES